jgi:predicted DNA-binding transcriptional regulator YafY
MIMVKSDWPERWDLLLRYRLIETVAYWEQRLTTNHLMHAFGIGRQQASRDINAYLKDLAPGNLVYDTKLKGYRPTEGFTPKFTRCSPDEYLHLLATQSDLANSLEGVSKN